jgi:hypothetical protein
MKAWPPFIGLCLLSTGCVVGRNHTSDADLQRNFLRHEAEFETLLRDVTADEKLQMLRPYALRYAGATVWNPGSISEVERVGLSRERWEKYQRQLRELGLAQVTKGGGGVEFRVDQASIWNGDSVKGYWYALVEPGPPKASLDSYRLSASYKNRFGGSLVSKPIRPNWYLYLFVN